MIKTKVIIAIFLISFLLFFSGKVNAALFDFNTTTSLFTNKSATQTSPFNATTAFTFPQVSTTSSWPFSQSNTISPVSLQVSPLSIWNPISQTFPQTQKPTWSSSPSWAQSPLTFPQTQTPTWSPSPSWGQWGQSTFTPAQQFPWASQDQPTTVEQPTEPEEIDTVVINDAPRIKDYSNSGCHSVTRGEKELQFDYEYKNELLYLYHRDAAYNCCIQEIQISLEIVDNVFNIYEEEILEGSGCRCICNYDLTTTVENLLPGSTYSAKFFDKESGKLIGEIPEIIISSDTLPQFSSCEKLREKLEELSVSNTTIYRGDAIAFSGAPTAMMADAEVNTGAADYSTTNIQVAGVDEADIIKNDGSYIYMIKEKSVRIIKAYPPEEFSQEYKIDYEEKNFTPKEIYIDTDKLIVIGSTYPDHIYPDRSIKESEIATFAPSIMPYPNYQSSRTKVFIYDISDRRTIKQDREAEFEADYLQSRKKEGIVYLIMNKYPSYQLLKESDDPRDIIPLYNDSAKESTEDEPICDCEDISYLPESKESNMIIIAAIPVHAPKKELNTTTILGGGQNIYASTKNLYVASTRYTYDEEPVEITEDEEPVRRSAFTSGMTSTEKTIIYKFELNENIAYDSQGEVPGRILNQFSMNERYYQDYQDVFFSIATTTGHTWNVEELSSNNLYVLDSHMKEAGKIEGIAPGEAIKSVRFLGEKAYMVTFVQVDPLFVITMKDPTHPQIVGQLKIPGYSEYLHPYDEDHLIGFGRHVDASIDADKIHTPGAVYYTALLGMKISLFDVSEPTNPKEKYNSIIGFRNTYSEVTDNQKALLFSRDKNLMALPITVTEEVSDSDYDYNNFRYTFQGAYIYYIDKNELRLETRVTHYDDENAQDEFMKAGYNFYGNYEYNIQRILYIGEYLYTISPGKIKAIDMADYSETNFIEIK